MEKRDYIKKKPWSLWKGRRRNPKNPQQPPELRGRTHLGEGRLDHIDGLPFFRKKAHDFQGGKLRKEKETASSR